MMATFFLGGGGGGFEGGAEGFGHGFGESVVVGVFYVGFGEVFHYEGRGGGG